MRRKQSLPDICLWDEEAGRPVNPNAHPLQTLTVHVFPYSYCIVYGHTNSWRVAGMEQERDGLGLWERQQEALGEGIFLRQGKKTPDMP